MPLTSIHSFQYNIILSYFKILQSFIVKIPSNVIISMQNVLQMWLFRNLVEIVLSSNKLRKIVLTIFIVFTAWKVSKYGFISGPYFPVFGLTTWKYRPEITPYLDTFTQWLVVQNILQWESVRQSWKLNSPSLLKDHGCGNWILESSISW